jgi:hypothetical protein
MHSGSNAADFYYSGAHLRCHTLPRMLEVSAHVPAWCAR